MWLPENNCYVPTREQLLPIVVDLIHILTVKIPTLSIIFSLHTSLSHNSLEDCVLVYLLSSRKRCVDPMCVMTTAQMNCVDCNGLSVRTCNSKVWIWTLWEACSEMLRVYSPCAWFVEGRPNPIDRRVSMTRNRTLSPHNLGREPFLRCAHATTQRWRRRCSKRRDSRFVFAVRASRWWEVVLREVVLQARLFERNCSRETVFRKTVLCVPTQKWFLEKSFYKNRFCEPLHRRRYSHSLHTYWEPKHADWVRLGTNDHN